ncbi:MAG: hypothetical protein JNL01_07815 [Bdellovibrionales bacterium]|nr:hypothetical protein [Bdellovibrionales bacterium]
MSERIVIGLAILIALLVLTLSQMSGAVRYYLFGTGLDEASTKTVGVVLSTQGTCERKSKNSMEFMSIKNGDPVYAQDTIVTASKSGCSISVVGDRTIIMGESSLVTLSFQLGLMGLFLNLPDLFETKSNSVTIVQSDQAAIDALKAVKNRAKEPVAAAKPEAQAKKYILPAVQEVAIDSPKEVRIQQPGPGQKIVATFAQAFKNEIEVPFSAVITQKDPKAAPMTGPSGYSVQWSEDGQSQAMKVASDEKKGTIRSKIVVKKPGQYVFQVVDSAGQVVKSQGFEVGHRVKGIDLKPIPSALKPKIVWSSKIPPPYTVVLSNPKEGLKKITVQKPELQLGEISAEYEYTAQILAITPDGFQYESETRKFGMAYTPPEIHDPKEGEKITAPRGKKITITWNKTVGAVSYTLDVAGDVGFTKTIAQIESPVNFSKLRFLNTGEYFARIHVKTRFGKTYIGPVRKFHVTIKAPEKGSDEAVY